jgi:group I intron endonuclease
VYREKPTCGIYKIHHKDTGKSYVGLSVDIFKRWKEHSNFWEKKEKWSVIKKALHKHGLENFTFTILEECSKEELNDREIHWIKELNTQAPNGYNMTAGGGGCPDPSPEVRAKISKAAKERIVTDETREILSLAHQGKIASDEHKAAISEAMKKVVRTDEHKLNNAKANYKACIINGVEYESLGHASEALNERKQTISRWILSQKWPEGMYGYYK